MKTGQKVTDARVRAITPSDSGQADYWFADGLGLRVGMSGKKTWMTMVRVDGKLRRIRLGHYPAVSVHKARSLCGDARELAAKGENPATVAPTYVSPEEREAQGYTVHKLADDFIRLYSKPHKRSWQQDQDYIDREIIPVWGKRPAHEITRREAARLTEAIAERGSPVTANRVLALLSKMFRWAVTTGRLEASPVVGIPRPAKEVSRERALSNDELRNLWLGLDNPDLAMSPAWRIALKLALVLGQRRGEIIGARWSEFDFDRKTWTIPAVRMKGGKDHTIPLSGLALDLLDEAAALGGEDAVFPGDSGEPLTPHAFTTTFRRHRKRLKLSDEGGMPTIHDLRRSAFSGITGLGFSRLVADKITAHADGSIAAVYDRNDYVLRMREALDAWASRIIEIVYGRESASNVVSMIRQAAE